MGQFAVLHTQRIESFEQIQAAITGTHREVIQLERGRMQGELSHGFIGNLTIDVTTFTRGMKSRGTMPADRLVIGMQTANSGRVTHASYEGYPGDSMIGPASELESRYYGGVSLIIMGISETDIESSFGTEGRLADLMAWRGNHFKGTEQTVQHIIPSLQMLIARLRQGSSIATAETAEFWKRAFIEAMTANIVASMTSERNRPLPSALRIVRQVEDYLDARENAGAIHISQICNQLRVSRRTLHRAFDDALGIGPIAFLRHRRLCAARTALRSDPSNVGTIADLALQHGFLNVGRFAYYYRQLFGENPSDTKQY